MTKFKELGEYLDNLDINGKLDQIFKILENITFPQIEVKDIPRPDDLNWSICSPRVNYECIQLTKQNVHSVRSWLMGESGFFEATIKDFGLDTDCGYLGWNDWIVLEPNGAVVFYTNDDFANCYFKEKEC